MNRILITTILASVLFIFNPNSANALGCEGAPSDPAVAVDEAIYIFEARISGQSHDDGSDGGNLSQQPSSSARLEVVKWHKGKIEGKELELSSLWGIDISADQAILFLVYEAGIDTLREDNFISHDSCGDDKRGVDFVVDTDEFDTYLSEISSSKLQKTVMYAPIVIFGLLAVFITSKRARSNES